MRISDNWKDYELIDTSSGERLERWGDIILIRPDPQIIWDTDKKDPLWRSAHARYHRSNKGGGYWETYKKVPDRWTVGYRDLTFNIKPMGFKHTGVFPEQAVNWDFAAEKIRNACRELKILNLFGYTGCATLSCMQAGASVCHVDASKGMVQWAKENAQSSGPTVRCAGWWMIASSLCSARSAAATAMTGSLWIRRPTAEAPAARSGSSKNSFFHW